MPWAVAMMNLEAGKMQLIEKDCEPDADDPRYGDEVHIVPCKDHPTLPNHLSFGVHDFHSDCYCHPEVREQVFGRTMVIHREAVN